MRQAGIQKRQRKAANDDGTVAQNSFMRRISRYVDGGGSEDNKGQLQTIT